MDNESSDESAQELDNEHVQQEDNVEVDGNNEQIDAEIQESQVNQVQSGWRSSPDSQQHEPLNPTPRKETIQADIYDIVPTIAAPHSTSINAVCSTPDLHWVFSGGSDGYIRKYNWIETANGKSMLTVAQRHPFVDSVTKAGVLTSYWENSDATSGKPIDDAASLSAVYSLAVQQHALWLLSGLGSGGINLQSVRHDEGKRIHTLRGHTSAVSVLNLAADERSFLSGSWDKNVLDWDLNTGKVTRNFQGSTGQISALETRPDSALPVPETLGETVSSHQGFSEDNANEPKVNGLAIGIDSKHGSFGSEPSVDAENGTLGSPADSLFGGNDADSLFGDSENLGAPGTTFHDDENDFSKVIATDFQDQEKEQPSSNSGKDVEDNTVMNSPSQTFEGSDGSIDVAAKATEAEAGLSRPMQPDNEPLSAVDESKHSDKQTPLGQLGLPSNPGSVFLAASIDGSLRVWDKRQPSVVAKITPHNVPPWCMNACWSPDGNTIYAGRRNGTVDEYNLHKGLRSPTRNFKLPNNSGAVSAVKVMPNGRHLICASYDILRLYDLQERQIFKHATVPFLIIPGHRTSIVSQLFFDPTYRYMLSAAGNRGWEGSSSEVLLGYEVNVPR